MCEIVLIRAELARQVNAQIEVEQEIVAVPDAASIQAQPGAPSTVQSNPDRVCFFGKTHSHTSWSMDAYLLGNHLTTPEDAYKYSLGMQVKHPAGYEVKIKGRPLDFHGVTDH